MLQFKKVVKKHLTGSSPIFCWYECTGNNYKDSRSLQGVTIARFQYLEEQKTSHVAGQKCGVYNGLIKDCKRLVVFCKQGTFFLTIRCGMLTSAFRLLAGNIAKSDSLRELNGL